MVTVEILSGEANRSSKLTWAKVDDIRARAAAGETQKALAKEYGVTETCVHKVITHQTWFNRPKGK